MKTANRKFSRLLSLALVFLLALTAAVPVFAANTPANTENLKITIHSNEGLPEMTDTQFGVYQLFSGTPKQETNPEAGTPQWDALHWNDYVLADIEWGASINTKAEQDTLLDALKDLDLSANAWAGTVNPFATVASAADVAEVLSQHTDNKFMQGFADFLMKGNKDKPFLKDLDLTGTLGKEPGDDGQQTLSYDLQSHGTGYYIFQDKSNPNTADVVSEYIVAVMGSQDIDLKASLPKVDKEIVNGDNNTTEGDVAGVSDYVQFKLIGTLPQNFEDFDVYKYTFHDTLSAGLTYIKEDDATHPLTVTVYNNSEDAAKNAGGTQLTLDTNYTVKTPGGETETPCTIEVSFDDLRKITTPTLTHESVIVVTYWAQVNENAVIGSKGNPNEVYLEYSNDPHDDSTGKTNKEYVYVFAFGLDLTKIGSDAEHGTGNGLPGAGFVLSKKVGNDTYYAQFDTSEGKKVLKGWVKQSEETPSPEGAANVDALIDAYKAAKKTLDEAKEAEKNDAQTALDNAKTALNAYLLESGDNGKIPDITGLDEGDYTLKEVIVPAGYNSMDDFDLNIAADIDKDGNLKKVVYTHDGKTTTYLPTKEDYDNSDNLGGEAKPDDDDTLLFRTQRFTSGLLPDTLVNQKAPFLPFTGGIGTMIFYVLGTALIVGAVTYLVIASRKRNKAEETA